MSKKRKGRPHSKFKPKVNALDIESEEKDLGDLKTPPPNKTDERTDLPSGETLTSPWQAALQDMKAVRVPNNISSPQYRPL